MAILSGIAIDDLDEGTDTPRGYLSLRRGVRPELKIFAKEAQEAAHIVTTVKAWLKDVAPSDICIAARTRAQLRDRSSPMLKPAGVPVIVLDADSERGDDPKAVRMATMHRMKGLEFKRVLLVGVQNGTVPSPLYNGDSSDEAHLLRERCLLYVASTRARDRLLITGDGEKSPLL